MGRIIAILLFSFLSLLLFPQAPIRGRSQTGQVKIPVTSSAGFASAAEIKGRSTQGAINIVQSVSIKPPQLQAENLLFVDSDNNNIINANENAKFFFTLRNAGEGPALNLEVKVTPRSRVPGVTVQPPSPGTLQAGETRIIEIPVSSDINTATASATFNITISEANGFGTDVGNITVQTQAMPTPAVSVASIDYGGKPVRKNEKFEVHVLVRNTGQGTAENVNISVSEIQNVFETSGLKTLEIGNLAPNESKEIKYTFITNNNYNLSKVILPFTVSERYGRFADNSKSTATIPVDLQFTSGKEVIVTGEQRAAPETRQPAPVSSLTSDVDRDIPVIKTKTQNKVALIIGNEDYSKAYNPESNVDYAAGDARVFAEYTRKVLGMEDKYVLLSVDATFMVMKSQVQRAIDIAKVMGPSAEIIFYYAGHGFPDQTTKIPYLIPVDVSASNITSAIKLADIYAQLSNSGANRVTVFLDACFSGGGRDMGPVNARSVRMAPNTEEEMVTGNMVVFTASTGEQTAQALNREKHGLFTYYLLKKLKETSGNVTYGELFDYILKNVQLDALTENNKPQVPVIIAGGQTGDKWRTWKLR
ncbi:MAG: caspase family protein [Bacteroidales bacterium]|nr:caspase family protein [Bacteroidales bacterium]